MKKWICEKCGYAHYGEEAPMRCPKCGAPKSAFHVEKESNGCGFRLLAIIMLVIVIVISFFISCESVLTVNNTPVQKLEINRFIGKWYEIARFDHRFERNLTHCIATYTLDDNGDINVTNKGKKKGRCKISEGKAKLTNTPGLLRVSFFGPFYSDYRVLLVDQGYSYALVGGNSNDYLWILSRTPTLSIDKRAILIQEAHNRGYNTTKLIWVDQERKQKQG